MSGKDLTPTTFTARDFQLLAGAMKCMKHEVIVDYVKFSTMHGFKNANSGKAAWCNLKRKLDKMSTAAAVEPSLTIVPADRLETQEKVPEKGKGRKRKHHDDGDADDREVVTSSKKRGKAPSGDGNGKASVAKGSDTEDGDEDDVEELPKARLKGKGLIKHELGSQN